jgi:hypothetical protein
MRTTRVSRTNRRHGGSCHHGNTKTHTQHREDGVKACTLTLTSVGHSLWSSRDRLLERLMFSTQLQPQSLPVHHVGNGRRCAGGAVTRKGGATSTASFGPAPAPCASRKRCTGGMEAHSTAPQASTGQSSRVEDSARAITDVEDVVPALVVFDLDACLWLPEMYQLDAPPGAWDEKAQGVRAGKQARVMHTHTHGCFPQHLVRLSLTSLALHRLSACSLAQFTRSLV